MTIFGNYWTPSIFRQRLKLEIRNLACRLIAMFPIVQNENFGKKGSPGDYVTIFGNFGTPPHISAKVEARNSKFGTQIDREVPYRKKMKILVKRGHQGVT